MRKKGDSVSIIQDREEETIVELESGGMPFCVL